MCCPFIFISPPPPLIPGTKSYGGGGDMVWFWLLGLSASVLAGREARLPHQLPGPRATLIPDHQGQKAHREFSDRYIPCWMVCKFSKLISQRTDHLHGHKKGNYDSKGPK